MSVHNLCDHEKKSLVDYPRLPARSYENGVAGAHRLYECLIGLWAPAVVEAADDLGVFAELAVAPAAASRLAGVLGLDERAARVLLDALYAYGLLDRHAAAREGYLYELPPYFRSSLLREGASSLTGKFTHDRRVAWPAWFHLSDTVRAGTPGHGGEEPKNGISGDDYRSLVGGISFWAEPIVDLLASALAAMNWAIERARAVLDIGCGTGLYSQLLLERFTRWTAVGIEAPGITPIADSGAGARALNDRFHTVAGDLWSVTWPRDQDLILFANIFHLHSPRSGQQLLRLAADALTDDGLVCIVDQIRVGDDERSTPQDRFALLFAASMLATGGGDTYKLKTYDRWLMNAGLRRVELIDAPMHRILLARRSDSPFLLSRATGPPAQRQCHVA
jgi:SAM-dependent methyltransferase